MALTVFRQTANPDSNPLHVIMNVPSKDGKPSLTTRKLSFVGGVYATEDEAEIAYLQEHVEQGDCVIGEEDEVEEPKSKPRLNVRPTHGVTKTADTAD